MRDVEIYFDLTADHVSLLFDIEDYIHHRYWHSAECERNLNEYLMALSIVDEARIQVLSERQIAQS